MPASHPTPDRAATDRAAELAVAQVVASYLAEVAGRPLNRRQQALADRAARLARHLDRAERRMERR
jgi:hypothetical protein